MDMETEFNEWTCPKSQAGGWGGSELKAKEQYFARHLGESSVNIY